MTPKQGLSGQFHHKSTGTEAPVPAVITVVNGDGTVNCAPLRSTSDKTSLEFVDVGGTPPVGADYFQAIDAVN